MNPVFFQNLAYKAAYYSIRGIDIYGRIYTSVPRLGQALDSIPPAKPVGLRGEITKKGNVKISWSPNTESDLYGYKVYYSNIDTADYSQLTNDVVKDTVFYTEVDLSFGIPEIYYHVVALDYNS